MKARLMVRPAEIAVRVFVVSLCMLLTYGATCLAQEPQAAAGTAVAKAVGKVKSISGNVITLTTDAGSDLSVQLTDTSRLLRTEPGQKDLKSAAAAQLQDIQPGDRVLARGSSSADGKSMVAATVIVMKAADVSARLDQEREDWKAHGVGGLVSAVDPNSQFVTISIAGFAGNKTVKVNVAKDTIFRRYAPDSVKFDDAKPAAMADIKVGDQLRARGAMNADKTELTAQEMVFGTFRNIAGTVISADPAKNMLVVNDLATKKPLTLTTASDSQLRKLPQMVAQRIAMRLKGVTPDNAAAPAAGGNGAPGGVNKSAVTPPNGDTAGRPAQGDFQQILARLPAVTLAELQKGDAVMIVSTEGTASEPPKAITLLTGVEPILSASPDSGRAAMLLSPWNLGGGGEGAGANP
jgi:hypothetical protein